MKRITLKNFFWFNYLLLCGILLFDPINPKLKSFFKGEAGYFEISSAILLFCTGFYLLKILLSKKRAQLSKNNLLLFSFACFISFFMGFEEISWGQHIFNFNSNTWFFKQNLQHETNLHNLIPLELFQGVIDAFIFCFFVIFPCLYFLREKYEPIKWMDPLFNRFKNYFPKRKTNLFFLSAFIIEEYASYNSQHFILKPLASWFKILLPPYFIFIQTFHRIYPIKKFIMMMCTILLATGVFMLRPMVLEMEIYEAREMLLILCFIIWLKEIKEDSFN